MTDAYGYYISLPAGARLTFKNVEVVKMASTSSYDGIDESTVVDINSGTIHHISEFVFFSDRMSMINLLCADGTLRSEYTALIEQGQHNSKPAIIDRAMLEGFFGKDHHIILDFDRLIRFENFKRKTCTTKNLKQ